MEKLFWGGGIKFWERPSEQRRLFIDGSKAQQLEKEMATHMKITAWRIPEEHGGLQSMGSKS